MLRFFELSPIKIVESEYKYIYIGLFHKKMEPSF